MRGYNDDNGNEAGGETSEAEVLTLRARSDALVVQWVQAINTAAISAAATAAAPGRNSNSYYR